MGKDGSTGVAAPYYSQLREDAVEGGAGAAGHGENDPPVPATPSFGGHLGVGLSVAVEQRPGLR